MSRTVERHPVLLVSSRPDDHAALRKIFRDSPWELCGVFTGSDGLRALRRDQREISVVVCEHILPDGDWKFLLAELDKLPIRPSLLVYSRLADERLWAEVLTQGAFDLLLAEPFEAEEVLRVTESAWRAGNRSAWPRNTTRIDPEPAWSLAGSGPEELMTDARA